MVDSLVRNALSGNRGGGTAGTSGTDGGGGEGGFFTKLRQSGLFSEKNGNATTNDNEPGVTVSGAGRGGKAINELNSLSFV